MTAAEMGDVREAIGGLKNAVQTLIDTVRVQDDRTNENRKSVSEKLDAMDDSIKDLTRRVGDMEPHVSEYKQRMAQVKTAGVLGVTLWKFGGIVLGVAATLAGYYYAMTGRTPP